jgi:hypothetical protein
MKRKASSPTTAKSALPLALARITELEDGMRFVLGRIRHGGDWIAVAKCSALLRFPHR